jgi:hypothetical protein
MNKKSTEEPESEMRPEYDFSKMKFVGRGIYAERYREGVKFSLVHDNEELKTESNEQSGNISD